MTIRRAAFLLVFFTFLIVFFSRGFFTKKHPFVRIPILFFESKNPCLQVEIEGKKFYFALDSGADLFCAVDKLALDGICNKKQAGSIQTFDIKGNDYRSPLFIINSIQVGKINISNAIAKEEDPEFLFLGSVLKNPNGLFLYDSKIAGRMGAKFLRSIDYWAVDFPNSVLVAKKNLDEVKSQKNLIQVDLERVSPLIIISIQTAVGAKKFVLDTGASRSILRTPIEFKGNAHNILTTEIFKIGEHDFGPTKLYLFDMNPAMEFDGLLGRDFLAKYPVYLDFRKNRIYIDFPFESCR